MRCRLRRRRGAVYEKGIYIEVGLCFSVLRLLEVRDVGRAS